VTVLPSFSSLRALRRIGPAASAISAFLGIGNPALTGSPSGRRPTLANVFRGALADVDKVRALP
jgi:hypothetical protein